MRCNKIAELGGLVLKNINFYQLRPNPEGFEKKLNEKNSRNQLFIWIKSSLLVEWDKLYNPRINQKVVKNYIPQICF